jgi:ArsR family transcriptional regulator
MRLVNFAGILIVAAALAGYSALASPRGGPSLGSSRSVPAADEIRLVDRADAETLWRDAGTLFIDVRSDNDFAYGHIRGALALPYEELETCLPSLRPRLERATALVVYCKSVDCGKSLWAALALRRAGLSQVCIYPEGWYDWLDAEFPVERDARR